MSIHEIEVDEADIRKAARVIRPGESLFLAKIPAGAKFVKAEVRDFDRRTVIVYELPDDKPATVGLAKRP